MYTPPAFAESDPDTLRALIAAHPFATLVTTTDDGLLATPLPLLHEPVAGSLGVLHGHLARANPQGSRPAIGEALALFSGPDAYITPGWYESKREHGKVVPTWNYVAVHVYGTLEIYDDAARLHDVVSRLTERHEAPRIEPWAVIDAPERFIASQLKGIVGLRLAITRIEGKQKLSQNRPMADRIGVAAGLAASPSPAERVMGELVARAQRGD